MKRRSSVRIAKQPLQDGKVVVRWGKREKKFVSEYFADIFIADLTVSEFERKLEGFQNTEPPDPEVDMLIGGKRLLIS
jgi:hypothetical protein